ncbi:MAG: hypothetical protein JW987_01070 [Anaerolineaceae bacterium]|nr:hypothetical protein [Anaerolineaceae bacterium]
MQARPWIIQTLCGLNVPAHYERPDGWWKRAGLAGDPPPLARQGQAQ